MEKKEAVQEKKPAKELSLINSYCIHKTMGYNRKRIIKKNLLKITNIKVK